MNRQGNMVQISPERLRLFCSKNGGQTVVSETLGYGKSFISNALHSGKMSRAANKLLAATYGIPENFFLAPDPPKTALPPEPKDAQQGGEMGTRCGCRRRTSRYSCCWSTTARKSAARTRSAKTAASWR